MSDLLMLLISTTLFEQQITPPPSAQSMPPPSAQSTPQPKRGTNDVKGSGNIIVDGYRTRRSLPTFVDIPNNISAVKARTKYEMADRIAACASRGKIAGLSRLRAVVDGEFNSPLHAIAQDRLKRTYITCSEGVTLLSFTSSTESPAGVMLAATALTNNVTSSGQMSGTVVPNSIDAVPLGHSIYDRGAFTIRAMQTFTPDLTLTREQTLDPLVQERFNLREIPRNRFRAPSDYEYFEVAVCMVRLQPALAVRLTLNDKPAKLDGLQAALINRARICVGNSRHVQVDPTQFRIYIADAVYRWAVAAKNVESLIPLS